MGFWKSLLGSRKPAGKPCARPWQQISIGVDGFVTPCCNWREGRHVVPPLGNVNKDSLLTIWNGPGYRKLRKAFASGDLAGLNCLTCQQYIFNGDKFPEFQWPGMFSVENGLCWIGKIPPDLLRISREGGKPILLLEDGEPLPRPGALHADIRTLGGGRYSIWGKYAYFSPPDNSNPILNGRSYSFVCGDESRLFLGMDRESASGRNVLLAWDEYREGKPVLEAKPTMLTVATTLACNIRCQSCTQHRGRMLGIGLRDGVEEEMVALSDTLVELVWNGGESLATRGFRKFVEGFERKRNPNLHLLTNTNGMLLNADVLAWFDEFPRVSLDISMDSFSKETFELIRTGASHEKVMENMRRAVDASGSSLEASVSILVQKDNILELPGIVAYAARHDIPLSFAMLIEFPHHKRIDMFEDMPSETKGWLDSLDRAIAAGNAVADGEKAPIRFANPEHALVGVRSVVSGAMERYADTRSFSFRLDNAEALSGMPCPGLSVGHFSGNVRHIPYSLEEQIHAERFIPIYIDNVVAYALLGADRSEYVLRVPSDCGDDRLYVAFFADMFSPEIPLLADVLSDGMVMTVPAVTVYDSATLRKRRTDAGKADTYEIVGDYGSDEYAEWYRGAIRRFMVFR